MAGLDIHGVKSHFKGDFRRLNISILKLVEVVVRHERPVVRYPAFSIQIGFWLGDHGIAVRIALSDDWICHSFRLTVPAGMSQLQHNDGLMARPHAPGGGLSHHLDHRGEAVLIFFVNP